MARTEITVQEIKSPFAVISAGGLDFTMAALDAVNGNQFTCVGREIIILENTDAGAQTVTINSAADEKNREGDLSAYSLAANDFVVAPMGLTNSPGWKQSDGKIQIDTSSANIKIAVLRLPAGFPH